ncbi:MAG: hypothetical protein ACRECO_01120 [Xanthobacteraceae bacterium]
MAILAASPPPPDRGSKDRPPMLRQWMCLAAYAFALAGWLASVRPAAAIEIHCIEASKYKYLYRLFDDDRRKAAAFLRVAPSSLPDGEICRAAIVTGSMISPQKAKKAKQTVDSIKLLRAIERNRGWLATLYLASGGGSVGSGITLAKLTRLFWLKTVSLEDKVFPYHPDFGVLPVALPRPAAKRAKVKVKAKAEGAAAQPKQPSPPPEPIGDLAAGWRAYLQAAPYRVEVPTKRPRVGCASACTYPHVAGIDRRGVMYVHRPRFGSKQDAKKSKHRLDMEMSMTDTLKGMQRSEATIIGIYREMDAGDEVIRLFERTPTATVRPIAAERFPRYVADYLRDKCGADVVALERREIRIRAELAKSPENAERLRALLGEVRARRGQVETCVAVAHEAERLKQFAKYCSGATCNRKAIAADLGMKKRSAPKKK